MWVGILFKSGQKLKPVLFSSIKSAVPFLFVAAWPLLAIRVFGQEFWGKCVDIWLYFFITSLFISWGNRQHLLKKFNLYSFKKDISFSENFFSRLLLYLVFLLFGVFSPFDLITKFAIIFYTTGRFITKSYEPVIEYYQRFKELLYLEVFGFLTGTILIVVYQKIMTPSYFLFFISIGELLKALLLMIVVKDIKLKFSFHSFKLDYYIQSFPVFVYSLALVVLCLVDRIYVYVNFTDHEKAFYQVFMTFLVNILSFPGYLLTPFIKNVYKGKIRLNANIRFNVFVGGLTFLPLLLMVNHLIMVYIFGFSVNFFYLILGFFFCFPSFVYGPVFYFLVGKNQQFDIAIAAILITIIQLLICPYFIGVYQLYGAMITAIIGQWLMMVASMYLYFQEKNAKKIKLIK